MPDYTNELDHPVDLADGRLLEPGQKVTLTDEEAADSHNKSLGLAPAEADEAAQEPTLAVTDELHAHPEPDPEPSIADEPTEESA